MIDMHLYDLWHQNQPILTLQYSQQTVATFLPPDLVHFRAVTFIAISDIRRVIQNGMRAEQQEWQW